MKQCPSCHRTYTDTTMVFCLEDGKVLNEMITSSAPTQYIPAAKFTNEEVATVVAHREAISNVASNYEQTQISSNKNWLIFGVVGLFAVFVLGAIGMMVVFKNEIFGGTSKPVFTSNNNSNNNNLKSNSANQTPKNSGIWESKNDNNNTPSPTVMTPSEQLVGIWLTKPGENDFQETITVNINSNATFSQVYKDRLGNSGSAKGKWHLSGNTFSETFSTGEFYTGPFKFIDSNTFEITTVDNKNPTNNGKKLLYHRIKS